MKILIGFDGSECSQLALDDLVRAGLPAKAEAIVMTVAEVWLPPPSALEVVGEVQVPDGPMYENAKAKTQVALEQARQAQERIRKSFPNWQVTIESEVGSPAWEIVAKADSWKPELVVVGSHGRSALSRFVLGSVAQRVVTESRCSVRVSRGKDKSGDEFTRVICGLDGSPGSEAAVREIARRSWPKGTEVKLIVANDPLTPTFIGKLIPPLAATIEESNLADLRWIESLLRSSVSILRSSGVVVSTAIRDGDPKRVLVEEAQAWEADCIFVGSTGFSNRLERFVLGSVSAAVVGRADCSVEVVR